MYKILTTCKGIYRFRTADRQADWGSGRYIILGIWQVHHIRDLEGILGIWQLYWGSGRYGILGIWQVRYIGDLAGILGNRQVPVSHSPTPLPPPPSALGAGGPQWFDRLSPPLTPPPPQYMHAPGPGRGPGTLLFCFLHF